MNPKIAIICVFSIFLLSGCSFFEGQYQPSSKINNLNTENDDNFLEADKLLEKRLDDIASGRAVAGEYSEANNEADDNSQNQNINENNMDQNHSEQQGGPEPVIEANKKYRALLKTEEGNIVIDLFAEKTPFTVNNFVYLSKLKFYDNTIFHRVIDGFMIQGGDPNGDGSGNPGYQFADEPFEGEYSRGIVAMANSGPNTNGSQFFIMHADYPLPKNYVIFGKVISGLDVVDNIAEAPVTSNAGGETSKPIKPIKILNVEIIEE